MRIWKLPDQIIRLAILVVVAVVAIVAVRSRLIPASFGETGHYRADAVAEAANRPLRYAGSQLCVECHDSEGAIKNGSYHRTLACEVCHGPAFAHANDPDAHTPLIPRQRGSACLYCHDYLPSRPTGFPQILERLHNPLEPCVGCHDPHDPTPPEVPESCSACHTQIARTKAVSHHGPLACERCHEVVPEHREQPRAFLPRKPTSREFCGQCHDRGAEAAIEIPRVDSASHGERYLCWQCHYPHFPEG